MADATCDAAARRRCSLLFSLKHVSVSPRNAAYDAKHFEVLWRAGSGPHRGGRSRACAAGEWEALWGQATEGNTLPVPNRQRRSRVVLSLAVFGSPGSGTEAQYSGEVELSVAKLVQVGKAEVTVYAVFPLRDASAEVTMHVAWRFGRSLAGVEPAWGASPYDVVCAVPVAHPRRSYGARVDAAVRRVHGNRSGPAAAVLHAVGEAFGSLSRNPRARTSMGLQRVLVQISDVLTREDAGQLGTAEASAQCSALFHGFVTAHATGAAGAVAATAAGPCKLLLAAVTTPEESLLQALQPQQDGALDVSLLLPQYLGECASEIASAFDLNGVELPAKLSLLPPASEDVEGRAQDGVYAGLSAKEAAVERHRRYVVYLYGVLKTALHRYVYSRVVVPLRRPPLAFGPWLERLDAARGCDAAIREGTRRLREQRGADDLRRWGAAVDVPAAALQPAVALLAELRGAGAAPYDAVQIVARACARIVRVVEGVAGGACADVFFPLLTFCLAEADLPDTMVTVASAEHLLLHRAASAHLVSAEASYYFASFKAAAAFFEAGGGDDSSGEHSCSESTSSAAEEDEGDEEEEEETAMVACAGAASSPGVPLVNSREWRRWIRCRREQIVRDRANASWLAGVVAAASAATDAAAVARGAVPATRDDAYAQLHRHPKLIGRRRGWYWRHGLSARVQQSAAGYVCHVVRGGGRLGPDEEADDGERAAGEGGADAIVAAILDQTASSRRLIEQDLLRILPGFGDGVVAQQEYFIPRLRGVLTAHVSAHPDAGYVQGMGYLAMMFLLHSDTEDAAFVGFSAVLQLPIVSSFYSFDTTEMETQFRVFDRLLHTALPALSRHFRAINVAPRTFLFDWWMTLWTRQFRFDTVAAPLWSIYLGSAGQGAPHILHGISIGILRCLADRLLRCNEEEALVFLTQIKQRCDIDEAPLLRAVEQTLAEMTAEQYTNVCAAVARADPGLSRMQPYAYVSTARTHATAHRRASVSPPQEEAGGGGAGRAGNPVAVVEWARQRALPAACDEVPGLHEWVWRYSKYGAGTKWDALLRLAEGADWDVRICGVDFAAWVRTLVTNWAETDDEYVTLLDARRAGLVFTDQVTDAHRRPSPSSLRRDSPLLHRVLARIPQPGRRALRGCTPAAYLAVAEGRLSVERKGAAAAPARATTAPTQRCRRHRCSDAYTASMVPNAALPRREGAPSAAAAVAAAEASKELRLSLCLWCSEAVPLEGCAVAAVVRAAVSGEAAAASEPLRLATEPFAASRSRAQLSPTQTLSGPLAADAAWAGVVLEVRRHGQRVGRSDVLRLDTRAEAEVAAAAWVEVRGGGDAADGDVIGKVKVRATTAPQRRRQEAAQAARRTVATLRAFPAAAVVSVAEYAGPGALFRVRLLLREWDGVLGRCLRLELPVLWGGSQGLAAVLDGGGGPLLAEYGVHVAAAALREGGGAQDGGRAVVAAVVRVCRAHPAAVATVAQELLCALLEGSGGACCAAEAAGLLGLLAGDEAAVVWQGFFADGGAPTAWPAAAVVDIVWAYVRGCQYSGGVSVLIRAGAVPALSARVCGRPGGAACRAERLAFVLLAFAQVETGLCEEEHAQVVDMLAGVLAHLDPSSCSDSDSDDADGRVCPLTVFDAVTRCTGLTAADVRCLTRRQALRGSLWHAVAKQAGVARGRARFEAFVSSFIADDSDAGAETLAAYAFRRLAGLLGSIPEAVEFGDAAAVLCREAVFGTAADGLRASPDADDGSDIGTADAVTAALLCGAEHRCALALVSEVSCELLRRGDVWVLGYAVSRATDEWWRLDGAAESGAQPEQDCDTVSASLSTLLAAVAQGAARMPSDAGAGGTAEAGDAACFDAVCTLAELLRSLESCDAETEGAAERLAKSSLHAGARGLLTALAVWKPRVMCNVLLTRRDVQTML